MIASWKRGFETARAASLLSNGKRVAQRMGAAIFAGSNLLSVGFNSWGQSHPHSEHGKGWHRNLHAELRACLRIRHYDNRGGLICYVWREHSDGKSANSRPCRRCQTILAEAGIRRVRHLSSTGEPMELSL